MRLVRRLSLVVLATAAPGACGEPAPPEPPFVSEVLVHAGGGSYEVRAEPLETLTDFRQLAGEAARFRGGGFIRVPTSATLDGEAQIREAFRVQGAHDLALDYQVAGGVVRANDYDTFAMLSLYRALENTRGFFRAVGVGDEALRTLPVFFRPRLEVFLFPLLASNNAAYSPPVDGFLFFNDFFAGNAVPLALNLGVVAHEYGHAVWQHLVWKDHLPAWSTDGSGWPTRAVNELRALDEGLADVFGATITDDPQFLGRSVAGQAERRDLTAFRVATAGDLTAAGEGALLFDPYHLGSIVASALWSAGAVTGRQALAGYVVEAERRLAARIGRDFRIGQFLDLLAAAAGPAGAEHRRALCVAFSRQLAALGPFSCCPGAGGVVACP